MGNNWTTTIGSLLGGDRQHKCIHTWSDNKEPGWEHFAPCLVYFVVLSFQVTMVFICCQGANKGLTCGFYTAVRGKLEQYLCQTANTASMQEPLATVLRCKYWVSEFDYAYIIVYIYIYIGATDLFFSNVWRRGLLL